MSRRQIDTPFGRNALPRKARAYWGNGPLPLFPNAEGRYSPKPPSAMG
jgi:hypothetical protein